MPPENVKVSTNAVILPTSCKLKNRIEKQTTSFGVLALTTLVILLQRLVIRLCCEIKVVLCKSQNSTHFAKTSLKIATSSHLRTYILKIFSTGPPMVGLIVNTGYYSRSNTLKIFIAILAIEHICSTSRVIGPPGPTTCR